jgi:hypothetical protein
MTSPLCLAAFSSYFCLCITLQMLMCYCVHQIVKIVFVTQGHFGKHIILGVMQHKANKVNMVKIE